MGRYDKARVEYHNVLQIDSTDIDARVEGCFLGVEQDLEAGTLRLACHFRTDLVHEFSDPLRLHGDARAL